MKYEISLLPNYIILYKYTRAKWARQSSVKIVFDYNITMRKRNVLQNYFSGPKKPNCSELGIRFIELFWLPKKLS